MPCLVYSPFVFFVTALFCCIRVYANTDWLQVGHSGGMNNVVTGNLSPLSVCCPMVRLQCLCHNLGDIDCMGRLLLQQHQKDNGLVPSPSRRACGLACMSYVSFKVVNDLCPC